MSGPSLGLNLGSIVDWTTSYPFLDLFRESREWYTGRPGTFDTGDAALLDLDAEGWVRGAPDDAPFDWVETIVNTGSIGPRPGVYVIDWKGEGDLNVNPLDGVRIISEDDHRITLEVTGTGLLGISFAAPETDDYIRDIRFYHRDDAELLEQGQTFNPDFLEKIQDFRVLRFMDWGNTNGSDVSRPGDMTPLDAARESMASGVSLATMVELANTVNADAWFCIPHLATDATIRAIATYVRDHLDPGLVARFEYSNEVWNWGFEQAQWAQQQAQATWGDDVQGGWMQWYGVRAANMANIVADVFGDDTGTRALNVFSTQSGWLGLEGYALDAPDHVADGGQAPRDAPFHVYAIAPYIGGQTGSSDNSGQIDEWIAMGEAGFAAAIDFIRDGDAHDSLANIGTAIRYHAGVADDLGWQLEAYEGGQHIVDQDGLFGGAQDPEQTQFFVDLVRRPEFFQIYLDYFAEWRDAGGGLMAHFSDFGPPGRYGSWGIWDSVWSVDTPRARAVEQFRDMVAAWWDDDRGADTFANGLLKADYEGDGRLVGKSLGDVLFGLAGDDILLGRGGADGLFGGKGADSLTGNRGADRLDGGRGDDLLSGGKGADQFLFSRGDGSDRIAGFQAGRDQVVLADGTVPAGWDPADHLRLTDDGAVLRLGQGDRIVFLGVTDLTGLADSVTIL